MDFSGTSYSIKDEDKQKLLSDGYLRLAGALPVSLLERWRKIADRLEKEALDVHAQKQYRHGACVIDDPVGPRLMRQDDLLNEDTDALLDLLSCPAMMAIARELCGRGSVPLHSDLLFKHQHPHPVVKWHQGAQHPRGYPYLNIGIYLDDADEGDGCLRYVPGTQHQLHDITSLTREHGWNIPGVVEQPAKAGDILIQDMMILHGSQAKWSPGCRRTIYVELRPVNGILESGAQSAQWAELRQRWMSMVVRRASPGDWPEAWCEDLPNDLRSDTEEVAAIIAHWEPPIPAVYSPESIETADYPVSLALEKSMV